MVDQCLRVEKPIAIPVIAYKFLRDVSREVVLQDHRDISFSEIFPNEVAIFCSFSRSGVATIYAFNEEKFEFLKKTMDILLIFPKEYLASKLQSQPSPVISLSRNISGHRRKKQHHNRNSRWYMWD
jgi:hypothetical protein